MEAPLHVVILAAGEGKRMRSAIPKVLQRIAGRPMLAHVVEAARALGLLDRTGTLEAGKAADLAIWDIERPAELVYRMGFNPLHARIWRG